MALKPKGHYFMYGDMEGDLVSLKLPIAFLLDYLNTDDNGREDMDALLKKKASGTVTEAFSLVLGYEQDRKRVKKAVLKGEATSSGEEYAYAAFAPTKKEAKTVYEYDVRQDDPEDEELECEW